MQEPSNSRTCRRRCQKLGKKLTTLKNAARWMQSVPMAADCVCHCEGSGLQYVGHWFSKLEEEDQGSHYVSFVFNFEIETFNAHSKYHINSQVIRTKDSFIHPSQFNEQQPKLERQFLGKNQKPIWIAVHQCLVSGSFKCI